MTIMKPLLAVLMLLGPLAWAQSDGTFKPGPYFAPWTRRVEQGDPVAMWELAEALNHAQIGGGLKSELQANAGPLLAKVAGQGDPVAMGCYAEWLFLNRRHMEALEWAQKAAAGGEMRGYEVMIRLYSKSTSPLQDQAKESEADTKRKLLQAEKANAGTLPTLYFRGGIGVPIQEQGWMLLTRAEKGDREAQFILGSELMSKSPKSAVKWGFFPKGTTPDMLTREIITQTARNWLIKAAAQDHWEAAMELGDQTSLLHTQTPGTEPMSWREEAERMLGGRNEDLIMYYEGHPDDHVEVDPSQPEFKVEEVQNPESTQRSFSPEKSSGKGERNNSKPGTLGKGGAVKGAPVPKPAKKAPVVPRK